MTPQELAAIRAWSLRYHEGRTAGIAHDHTKCELVAHIDAMTEAVERLIGAVDDSGDLFWVVQDVRDRFNSKPFTPVPKSTK